MCGVIDLDFNPIGFEAMDAEWWPVVANSLPRPWPREAVLFDLRWWRGQEAATAKVGARRRAKLPGRPALGQRWGWTDWDVRQVLRAEAEWVDRWTTGGGSSSAPPAALQPSSNAPPATARANAEEFPESSNAPPTVLQPPSSAPPHARSSHRLTDPPITDHREAPESPPPPDGGAAAPAAGTDTRAPTVAPWVPSARDCRGHPRAAVEAMVLRSLEAIRQRPVTPDRCATDARHVLGLWRALGTPDPVDFAAEVVLVAEWAQRAPDRLAARDLRAEGWAEGTDRSRSADTLCRREKWGDRLDAAQRWDRAGRPTSLPGVPVGAIGAPRRGGGRPGLLAQLVETEDPPRCHPGALDVPFEVVTA